MASPQLADGYVRIANELMEELARRDFSAREWRVLMVVIRETYGMNRKDAPLSSSYIAAKTGLDASNVRKTVRGLLTQAVLVKTGEASFSAAASVGIQKDYDLWTVPIGEGGRVNLTRGVDSTRGVETTRGVPVTRGVNMTQPEGSKRPLGLGNEADNHRQLPTPKDTIKDTMVPPHPPEGDGGGEDRGGEDPVERLLGPFRRRLMGTLALSGLSQGQLRKLRTYLAASAPAQRKAACLDQAIAEVRSRLSEPGHGIRQPVDLALHLAGQFLAEPQPEPAPDYQATTASPTWRRDYYRRLVAGFRKRLADQGREPDEYDLRDLAEWEQRISQAEAELQKGA